MSAENEEVGVENRHVGPLINAVAEARAKLLEESEGQGKTPTLDDEKRFAAAFLVEELKKINRELLASGAPSLNKEQQAQIREVVLETSFHGAQLWRAWQQEYPTAENLWVQGDKPCRVQTGGRVVDGGKLASSDEELRQAVKFGRLQSSRPNAPWDHLNHQLEYVMPDGTRVTATDFVCAHPMVTLRRPTLKRIELGQLRDNGTMSAACAEFLNAAVKSKLRILVGGSMNTGKTVLLRALAAALPKDAITVVVESQGELLLGEASGDLYPNFIFEMEARKAGADGAGEVSLNRLIEDAQRLSPTCVLVGEVRGQEAIALSKAVSQGYQVMATIHASSAREAVSNAGLYLEQYSTIQTGPALRRVADGIDVAVFMELIDGERRVAEVVVVDQVIDGVMKSDLVFDDTGVQMPLPGRIQRALKRNGFEF